MELNQYKNDDIQNVFGANDINLKIIEKVFGVTIEVSPDCSNIKVVGELKGNEKKAKNAIYLLFKLSKEGKVISEELVNNITHLVNQGQQDELERYQKTIICKTVSGNAITPKTEGQYKLYKAIMENNIIFASGPAGTGKTFIAAAAAVDLMKKEKINKIYLARPIVEAGEKLGFLPGDVREKVEMYLIPLINSIEEILGKESLTKCLEGNNPKAIIETGAVAYMRGLTFKDTIAIIDEAQNLTSDQFKLILSRIGPNSKIIICGDTKQADIEIGKEGKTSLELLMDHLEEGKKKGLYKTFATSRLTNKDIVRSQECLEAIELIEDFESVYGQGIGKHTKPNHIEKLCESITAFIETQNNNSNRTQNNNSNRNR